MSLLAVDLPLALAGLLVGFTVGLTGMGGGALMTPLLVLVFGVPPLAAVSSDLVVSLVMKPVGGAVHVRRGTVRKDLVRWLVIGSVPAAFAGALLLSALGPDHVEPLLRRGLGAALLAAAGASLLRRRLSTGRSPLALPTAISAQRQALTVAIGAFGGLIVGLTSVGSGSLIIVMLMLLHPDLTSAELVGTDLVQAVPLVASAALGHVLFGEVRLGLTTSLLVGALPGVYVGARMSARAPERVVRPALLVVLLTSGLKLLQVI